VPFFHTLTELTIIRYNIPDYFTKVSQACTLANIQTKMESGSYRNHIEFVYDFKTMFQNVFIYYPPDSPEYLKSLELEQLFNNRWETAEKLLR